MNQVNSIIDACDRSELITFEKLLIPSIKNYAITLLVKNMELQITLYNF